MAASDARRMTERERELGGEQPLIDHLVELRTRLIRSIAVVLVVFVGLVPFANRLYAWLAQPLVERLPEGTQMVAIDVVTPFLTPIKLAFFTAVIAVVPYLLYQAWAFVAPGLYRRERRYAMPLLISAIALFYIGCAFAYFVVLPLMFTFLTGVTPEGVSMMTDISRYLDFVLVLFLVFGLCFEVPVAVVILVLLGVVSVEQLKQARPYVIVGVFVIAAVATPPDVLSQILLAVPMWLLYEVGILVSRLLTRGETPAAGPADAGG
jgi:sec-independent protein translocase protein TatC